MHVVEGVQAPNAVAPYRVGDRTVAYLEHVVKRLELWNADEGEIKEVKEILKDVREGGFYGLKGLKNAFRQFAFMEEAVGQDLCEVSYRCFPALAFSTPCSVHLKYILYLLLILTS